MPNHDGTGPFGEGHPGKGLGPCGRRGNAIPHHMGKGYHKGLQRGGHGLRHKGWMHKAEIQDANAVYAYDKDSLLKEKSRLEKQILWITDRLTEIEG